MNTPRTRASLPVDLGLIASVIGEPRRANILAVLIDGRPHTAADLAAATGLSPSAATAHLHRLVEAKLVTAQRSGRFRHHQITDPAVARLVEAMIALTPPEPVTSLAQSTAAAAHRDARTCYDHLAGKLGVRLADGLARSGAIDVDEPGPSERAGSSATTVSLGPRGPEVFAMLGVDVASVIATAGRRPSLRLCIDWSERRPHLAGALGAAVLSSLLQRGWVARRRARALAVTPLGEQHLGPVLT